MMGSIIDKRERTRRRLLEFRCPLWRSWFSFKLADALLVWGRWQTDAWLTVEFGFCTGRPTADGGFARVQFVTELGDAVLLLNDFWRLRV